MAVKMEPIKTTEEKFSSLDAMALPVMIPATDSGKVLNRAAANQTENRVLKELRKFRILFEIGVPFVQKSLFTLLCLVHQVIHQGGISCQLHQTVLTVQFCI